MKTCECGADLSASEFFLCDPCYMEALEIEDSEWPDDDMS